MTVNPIESAYLIQEIFEGGLIGGGCELNREKGLIQN